MPLIQRRRSLAKVGYNQKESFSIPGLFGRSANKYSAVDDNISSRYFESSAGQGSRWIIIQTDKGLIDDDWYALSRDFRFDQGAMIEGDSYNEVLVNIQKFIDKTPTDYDDKTPGPPRFYKDRFGEFWVLGRNNSSTQVAITGAYGGVLIENSFHSADYLIRSINVWVGKQKSPYPPSPTLGLGYEIGSATAFTGPPSPEQKDPGNALSDEKGPAGTDGAYTIDPVVITGDEDKAEKSAYSQAALSKKKSDETPWLTIVLGGAVLAGGYYFYSQKKKP